MLLLVIVGGATASPVAASDGDRPLLPQDMNSTAVLAGEATTGCDDPVPGWKDSYGEGCKPYGDKKYCTSAGGEGSGWAPSWGAFAKYAVKGIDATMACCACGAKSFFLGAKLSKLAPGVVVTTRTIKTPKKTITGPSFTMGSDAADGSAVIEATGPNSAAFGVATSAKAGASFAAGRNTVADALGAFASGGETKAFSFNSAAFGMYNTLPDNPKGKWAGSSKGKWVATDPVFQIGVGTSSILGKDGAPIWKDSSGIWRDSAGKVWDDTGKDFPSVRADAFAVTKGGEVYIGKGDEVHVKDGEVQIDGKLFVGGKEVTASTARLAGKDFSLAVGTAKAQLPESFAAGRNTVADAIAAFASGEGTTAFSPNHAVFGQYNTLPDKFKWPGSSKTKWVATDPIFQIGVGHKIPDKDGKSVPAWRMDAFVVTKDGDVQIGKGCDLHKDGCEILVKDGKAHIHKLDVGVGGKNGEMNIEGEVNIKGKLVVNGKEITTSAMSSLMATPPDGTPTAALKAEVASLKEQLAAQGEKLSALEATVARLAAAK